MKTVFLKAALFVLVLAAVLIGGLFTRRLGTDQALILMLAPWVGWGLVALARPRLAALPPGRR